jgi:hypothetical protein
MSHKNLERMTMKNDKSNVIAGISMVFFLFAAMFPG